MVVKMAKWSPWPPVSPQPVTRKFQVKLTWFRLEGIENIFEWKTHARVLALKVKWKGEARKFGLHHLVSKQRCREDLSRVKMLEGGQGSVTWDDDEFENTCCFTEVSGDGRRRQFGPWRISFHVLFGKSEAKLVAVGKGSVDVSKVAATMESDIQWEIPVILRAASGGLKEASLLVNFTMIKIKDSPILTRIEPDLINRTSDKQMELDEPGTSLVTRSNSSWAELDRDKKASGWFSWKRRRMSQSKDEPLIKKTRSWNFGSIVDSVIPNSNQDKIGEYSEPSDEESIGAWESKELISRDGETKLKSDVFFATFDQRSDKAAGESACTALVAVISDWLHSNADATPTRPEFDDLIVQGSSEWRNLCDNASYLNDFPDKHFDLETVLRAGVRRVAISRDSSFVGFFNPEKFASLSGAMSFDEIWQKIVAINDLPRVYIISWNDHFFVLKIDRDAYYIIDTLGERLFEGCEKAFVLRFDDSSLMLQKENSDEDEKIISSGKECCREFIVRFLAAIPLEELEEEEKKEAVSYFSLHQRLQIEFNLTCMLSSSPFSSLSSSPFSSSAVSTPSRL
ncbi:PREDICTED: uncharacterized protein LOC109169600 [Ipomoea nil]|uniref:uncharacterized protein LOC109169600 n=1 Tax=Ipomoea nil TaxID=35883 RepID=UPI0009015AA5|nr:PREDICTED: uncharacterized protein LOC109169600 [Ipomoea nil]